MSECEYAYEFLDDPCEIRAIALREAIQYFAQVASRPDPKSAERVGALTVLGMADHFADYITTGTHPAPRESQDV